MKDFTKLSEILTHSKYHFHAGVFRGSKWTDRGCMRFHVSRPERRTSRKGAHIIQKLMKIQCSRKEH